MSGSKIVLDTNIIIYLLAGDETLSEFLQDKQAYVSVINELELIGYPNISAKELKQIKSFLDDCIIVDISEEIKNLYAELRKEYRLKLGDAVGAATAIYLDFPFMSADKVFSRIQELQLTSYTP